MELPSSLEETYRIIFKKVLIKSREVLFSTTPKHMRFDHKQIKGMTKKRKIY